MKGTSFTFFESYVRNMYGNKTCDEMLSLPDLETKEPFVGIKIYPDADMMKMVTFLAQSNSESVHQTLDDFGIYFIQNMAKLYPKPFLLSLDTVVHTEVNKIYPDLKTPKFWFEDPAPDRLHVFYQSPGHLCSLVHSCIIGVGKYYDVPCHVEKTEWVDWGADHCNFEVTFEVPHG